MPTLCEHDTIQAWQCIRVAYAPLILLLKDQFSSKKGGKEEGHVESKRNIGTWIKQVRRFKDVPEFLEYRSLVSLRAE